MSKRPDGATARGTTLSAMTLAFALDFGGTKVESALVDSHGKVVAASRFRAPTGRQATSDQLAAAVDRVTASTLASVPPGEHIIGAGIGCAGPIEASAGLVSPLNVPAWRRYPLREHLHQLVRDVPVRLQLDGLCITIAEHWVGAAVGVDNVMGMIVSTGVGGGLILDGRPIVGQSGNAGHIGHIEVGGFDDPCLCGGTGCLEAIASGPSTVAWAQTNGWHGSTGEELAASYAMGDPVAAAAVTRCGTALGHAIASATALTDLDLVTIGGGFSQVTPDLFGHIRAAIDQRAGWDFVTAVRVVPTGLSGDGPLIGAAALIHTA
ncbi:ROK family protein [Salinibacterium hongtaonis]|nr:ROK family protein [Salinibacterium hongtaonis]